MEGDQAKAGSLRGAEPLNILIGSLRGTKSLFHTQFPLSLEGEGDSGGEGDNNYQNPRGMGSPKQRPEVMRLIIAL